jgi:ketosteroid isomerase-like protein
VAVTAADVMRAYRDAARRGDLDAAFAFFAEDIVAHIPGRSAYSGERHGRAAAMRYINAARALSRESDVEVEVVDALTSETRFALVVVERFHRGGETLEISRANVYRVENGEIVEITIFEGDQYAADALHAQM